MKKNLCIFIFFILVSLPSYAISQDQEAFQKTWQDFSGICAEAMEKLTDQDRNSRTLMEFFTMRQPKYARLLKKAQAVLGNSETSRLFDDIDELKLENHDMAAKMASLKQKRIGAPESSLNPLKDTKKSIDKKLASLSEQINANGLRIAELTEVIQESFHKNGLNLSDEEINYFVISAEGKDLVGLITMAENMGKIQLVIEEELKNEPNNVELAKIYTGMYLVALESWNAAHEEVQKNLETYRTRLGEIGAEAKKNYQDASRLKSRATAAEAASLDANMNISSRTMEISKTYDQLLKRRMGNVEKSRKSILGKIALAQNTYNTLVNGGSLIALINAGEKDYGLLLNFEMPELKNIYDGPMLNAFAEIAEQLRTAQ